MKLLNGQEKKYLTHTLLRHLGLSISYTYGALLFYDITNSIEIVFILGLILFSIGFLMKTLFLQFFISLYKKYNSTYLMGGGLIITAIVNLSFFLFQDILAVNIILFIILIFIWKIGSGLYWMISNVIKYTTIGNSHLPASYSSYLGISRIIASILVSIVSIWLSIEGHFLILFIIASIVLFLSIIPLSKIYFNSKNLKFNLRDAIKCTPKFGFIANVNVLPEFFNYAIPLYLVLIFKSLPSSVTITGSSLIIVMILSYFTGKFKDKNNNTIILLAVISGILGLIILYNIQIAYWFVLLLSILGISWKIIRIGSDTRLGKEIVKCKNSFQAIIMIEIARSLGGILALGLFLITYYLSGTIPQYLFLLGIIFFLPRALYSYGLFEKKY